MSVIPQVLFWVVRGLWIMLAVGWGRCFCDSAVGTIIKQTMQTKSARTESFIRFSFRLGGYNASVHPFGVGAAMLPQPPGLKVTQSCA
jgi:hypothetical protein